MGHAGGRTTGLRAGKSDAISALTRGLQRHPALRHASTGHPDCSMYGPGRFARDRKTPEPAGVFPISNDRCSAEGEKTGETAARHGDRDPGVASGRPPEPLPGRRDSALLNGGTCRGAAALSKHLARPCAKCLRSRGACFAPTALRLGNATMALRWVPTQLSGALRQRSAIPGSSRVVAGGASR
ncbi:MAG: hypothetical protein MZV70_63560 [Desulfobacterales bacterium]|nr:hypothetical protein [Desulfobacterales bacterium]